MKNKRPSALSMKILERAYEDDILDDIIEKYNDSKLSFGKGYYEPSTSDIREYKLHVRDSKHIKQIANDLGVSTYCVISRFSRIGIMLVRGDIKL